LKAVKNEDTQDALFIRGCLIAIVMPNRKTTNVCTHLEQIAEKQEK